MGKSIEKKISELEKKIDDINEKLKNSESIEDDLRMERELRKLMDELDEAYIIRETTTRRP